MKIVINGRDDIASCPDDAIFGPILNELRVFCSNNDVLIQYVVLDGEDLTAAREAELRDKPVSDFEKMEISTGSRAETVRTIIEEIGKGLDLLDVRSSAAADSLYEGKLSGAIPSIEEVLDLLQSLYSIVPDVATIAGIDINEVKVGDQALSEMFVGHTELLGKLDEALKAQDTVALGDIFEYELKDAIDSWRGAHKALADETAGK